MKRISKENPFFDEVREYIEICSEKRNKPITECHKTIKVYKEEKNIEYRILAERFNTYKDKYKLEELKKWRDKLDITKVKEKDKEEIKDLLFYIYLVSRKDTKSYTYKMKNGDSVSVEVNTLNPEITTNDGVKIIHPKWHLLISYLAYIDAAYNHPETKLLPLWVKYNNPFPYLEKNIVLNTWLNEIKEDN